MASSEPVGGFRPALRFNALTPYFDAFLRVTSHERRLKRRLAEQARVRPGDAVLDVGAGTGTLAIELKRATPGATITGLDADPEIIARARAKAAEAGQEVELVVAMADAMPFGDASFDTVVSTLFFHHLPGEAKREALREIVRVLKPGGELHVADVGRPHDRLQRLLVLPVRVLDGFDATADNVAGALPRMFGEAGLERSDHHGDIRTPIGTVALYSARKPLG
jgi:ubiquinone/menaquinone biosynthesis C-methylase UbiE